MRAILIISTILTLSLSAHGEIKNRDDFKHLTLKQKIAQMFIFGFAGHSVNDGLKKTLNTLQPGAVVVFGRNIKSLSQISELNWQAQKISKKNTGLPLLIAVDQEGGSVIRIKTSPPLPSALTLGSSEDPALVRKAGQATGQLIGALGFNMNLAPVVDLSDKNVRSFIGNRSFSHKPETVSLMSEAFSQGLLDAKIIPTAKHFPGHGRIKTDSHRSTPYKKQTLNELFSTDLVPFLNLFKKQIPMSVMVAHIAYPLIDKSYLPATYSKPLIEGILRHQLKFDGIVLTDDIEMAGAFKAGKIGERAVKAIEAGNDLIMVGWNKRSQTKVIRAVEAAVKSGRIKVSRINESVSRLVRFKKNIIGKPVKTELKLLKAQIEAIPFKRVFDQIVTSSFTNSKIKPSRLPASLYNKRPALISYSWRFAKSFNKSYGKKTGFFPMRRFKTSNWKYINKKYGAIVIQVGGNKSAAFLKSIPEKYKNRIIVVNSGSKKYIRDESAFLSVVNVFSRHPEMGKFAAQYLKNSMGKKVSMQLDTKRHNQLISN